MIITRPNSLNHQLLAVVAKVFNSQVSETKIAEFADIFFPVDQMGVDILGVDNVRVDILGVDMGVDVLGV